ncbi:MAG: efflux RND transporter periplasmic adaptor subunit [Cytophagaceae bacterium]
MVNKNLILYLFLTILISSCFNKEKKANPDEFTVTSPILIDTFFVKEYVADIHAVKNVEVRARVKGYIEAIHVDEGQTVTKGQTLFSISSQEYKEDLLKAKANLKSAIAEAKAAELELQNVRTLVEKNVVSKTELEMTQSKYDALNAKIEEAKSHEVSAMLKLAFTEIKAPFDGIIDRIPNKIGSLIDEGTLLTTISDNHEIFAYFNVSEKEYLEFAANRKESEKNNQVTLVLANNTDHTDKGVIETIEGEIDHVTGSIAFRARFPNPQKILKHGSSGKVRLKQKVTHALIIPQKSTFEIQDKIFVYAIDEKNVLQIKSVTPKLRIPHLYILESGLHENDKIVYEGLQDLKPGKEITPKIIPLRQIIRQLSNQ